MGGRGNDSIRRNVECVLPVVLDHWLQRETGRRARAGASAEAADHSHGAGPHGGAVTDWGGGAYHVEFTVDHGKKESTVYVLASDAKTLAPIPAAKLQLSINDPAFQVDLTALPMEGDAPGASSRFVGQHDNFGIVREFAGSITGEVGGTPYAGDFVEVAAVETP